MSAPGGAAPVHAWGAAVPAARRAWLHSPGALVTGLLAALLLGVAVSIDFPRAEFGWKGDESTYYMLTYSLVRDGDFAYERKDLVRVWEEYHAPEGVFLKRGRTVRIELTRTFPYLRWVKAPDPNHQRLYFGKAFIYPLFAAPFVAAFGTNGFLVFHALLLAGCCWLGYVWLVGRGSRPPAAAAFAALFLLGSVVPVYFVWLTPEIFNFALVFAAAFLWSYKAVAPAGGGWLRSGTSDVMAAALVGIATFSKPTHAIVVGPIVLVAVARRQWARAAAVVLAFLLTAGGLFAANAAISGEFNYQGGERKTFYSATGFPFANERERFETIGPLHGRTEVQADILVNPITGAVFRHNLVYFLLGRHSGLIPYFFPGVVVLALFLARRRHRRPWQWLVAGTLALGAAALLFITPYTWAGGGGPVGNRYFLSFYPLFLVLAPPLATTRPAITAFAVGALFVGKLLVNPFWYSFQPGEHVKRGPIRLFPIELTMLNDLPVAAKPERSRVRLARGLMGYFPDDGAYTPEGESFWLRGKARADVILRAPLEPVGPNRWRPTQIERLRVTVRNGIRSNEVSIDTGHEARRLRLEPGAEATVTLGMPAGVPYKPYETPVSYVYTVTFRTTAGFVPFLETPPSSDNRFLGAMVTIVPELR
ncbi:MAG TPA: hypothetical protein VNI83_05775 [Vicinamibacterales bacterium]|nr:hypothetical protein [Vicinamibacterales bacterium]